jgi:hypothetical protein
MKLRVSIATLLFVFLALSAPAWAAKVQICHLPPGNPSNFHTITVNENALQAHLAHGDLAGPCSAHCSQLCDDGNACTIDACDASERCELNHPPVNCDDGNLCTTDSCSPTAGCASDPVTCTDSSLCTIDSCDPLTGQCVFPTVSCDPGQTCDPGTGDCVNIDPCEENPCVNGDCAPAPEPCLDSATCTPPEGGGGFVCNCQPGWTGTLCDIPNNPCLEAVC